MLSNDGTRSALHALGDKYGTQRLCELVKDEPSEQIRRLTS